MFQVAFPILILMLVAAVLGFLIAWVKRKIEIDQLQLDLFNLRNQSDNLQLENTKLIDHANLLLEEKRTLLANQEDSTNERLQLQQTIEQLHAEVKVLKTKASPKPIDKKQLKLLKSEIADLNKTIADKERQWDNKYKSIHFKLLQVVRERDELLKAQKNQLKTVSHLAHNHEPKKPTPTLEKIKNKFRKWRDKEELNTNVKQDLAQEYLDEIEQKKNLAETKQTTEAPDDLQVISGIGPFTEKKLNALGFYRYDHIAQMDEKDVLLVNKILELDPSYILEHEWIAQARRLK